MSEPLSTFVDAPQAGSAQPGLHAPEPGESAPQVSDGTSAIADHWVRAVGIPVFGLGIPRSTDLLAGLTIDQPIYWVGTLAFLALAAAIWHGNRWLLFEQRRHWGWFDHPARKVMMLLAAIVLFTVPITVTTLVAWYAARGLAVEVATLRTVVLMIVICVVFVTHVYETVFLIKERASDRVRVAELERT